MPEIVKDRVGTAPPAREQVLATLNPSLASEYGLKYIEFGAAKILAFARRRANWTMVFHQHQGAVGLLPPFGHIAFGRAHGGQSRNPPLEPRRLRHRAPIGVPACKLTRPNYPIKGVFAQFVADELYELHAKRAMGVRKARFSLVCQPPVLDRATDNAARLALCHHQPVIGELCQLLAGGFPARADKFTECGRRTGAMQFEGHQDSRARAARRPLQIFQGSA